MEGLAAALAAMGIEGKGASDAELWDVGGREAISEHIRELIDAALEAKEAQIGAEDWAIVERLVLLRSIDALWVEHLTELDDMRRGIGLRGYAQQDPLNEFRKEAFALYEELRSLIRHQVATTVFRVSVTRQAPPPPQPMPMVAPIRSSSSVGSGSVTGSGSLGSGVRTGAATAAGAAAAGLGSVAARGLPAAPGVRAVRESLGDQALSSNGPLRPGFTPSGQRIGRNDPCFCGSGQKYKKCHGR
jgi:preprotein translocase subunit SecA